MQDFRIRFIEQHLSKINDKLSHLNEWEQGFIKDIKRLAEQGKKLTNHQFNTLKDIAETLEIKR